MAIWITGNTAINIAEMSIGHLKSAIIKLNLVKSYKFKGLNKFFTLKELNDELNYKTEAEKFYAERLRSKIINQRISANLFSAKILSNKNLWIKPDNRLLENV